MFKDYGPVDFYINSARVRYKPAWIKQYVNFINLKLKFNFFIFYY